MRAVSLSGHGTDATEYGDIFAVVGEIVGCVASKEARWNR